MVFGSGDCPNRTSGFRATSKLIRSCTVGITKNRSRHRLRFALEAPLRPSLNNVSRANSRVAENHARSSDQQLARRFCEMCSRRPGGMMIMATAVCRSVGARSSASTFSSLQTEGLVGQSPLPNVRVAAKKLLDQLWSSKSDRLTGKNSAE